MERLEVMGSGKHVLNTNTTRTCKAAFVFWFPNPERKV